MKNRKVLSVLFLIGIFYNFSAAQNVKPIVLKAGQLTGVVQPTMYGVFFEDINFGADGGIYAEMIKNRSFEFFKPMMGWRVLGKPATEGDFLVINRKETNTANPRFLRVTLRNNKKGTLGLNNEGFRGMGIKEGVQYNFSIMYNHSGKPVTMYIELIGENKNSLGTASVVLNSSNGKWEKMTTSFKTNATAAKGSFNIWFEGEGEVDMDMISLFPEDTWKKRPGGMRADMIQMLADMKPGFLRFPGGCIVEGFDLSQRYQWKKTIGPVEERQLIINRWNFEFAHRPTPDYFQTFGLGFFEYFQLAEDIGAAPLPILNCGMACQFNSAEVAPMDQLDPYIQDALDLIEFANGDATTTWGRKRFEMGHPAPFNLTMMGVGNENWGPQYIERLKAFTKAIKEKYPDFKIIASSGTDPNGERYSFLNKELREMKADIIDEHYYRRPEWFLQNAKRYDTFPRNGIKIFAGEYAAQSDKTVSVGNRNNWETALSEAAFLTGLERNADVVSMASYAPLFAHTDGWQWTPDLLWVDNLNIYGTPNYYVQKLFSLNKGTDVVPALSDNKVLAGEDSLYASSVLDKNSNELIIKVVNVSADSRPVQLNVEGVKRITKTVKIITLKGEKLKVVNSFVTPMLVSPVETTLGIKGKKFEYVTAPHSFTIFKVGMQ
ncbi:MAG: alpha-L-arabinofuranosidase C-terminal domain-containing protein [Chitinophagaceae bacterium]